jgi:hypothetical protein
LASKVAEIVINDSLAIVLSRGPRTFYLDANRLADGQSTGTLPLMETSAEARTFWFCSFYFNIFPELEKADHSGKQIAICSRRVQLIQRSNP